MSRVPDEPKSFSSEQDGDELSRNLRRQIAAARKALAEQWDRVNSRSSTRQDDPDLDGSAA
jgi:hypothetical protein